MKAAASTGAPQTGLVGAGLLPGPVHGLMADAQVNEMVPGAMLLGLEAGTQVPQAEDQAGYSWLGLLVQRRGVQGVMS